MGVPDNGFELYFEVFHVLNYTRTLRSVKTGKKKLYDDNNCYFLSNPAFPRNNFLTFKEQHADTCNTPYRTCRQFGSKSLKKHLSKTYRFYIHNLLVHIRVRFQKCINRYLNYKRLTKIH